MDKIIKWTCKTVQLFNKLANAIPTKEVTAKETQIIIPDVEVTIDAPGSVESGSDFTVWINVSGIIDLNSGQFDLVYDADSVEIKGSEGGTESVSDGMIGNVSDGMIEGVKLPVALWGHIPSNKPGVVHILLKMPGLSTASGSGYLVAIHFHAK